MTPLDIGPVERALGAIGTTFRLTRLYPATHPAVIESMRQITNVMPGVAALGSIEWKIGATGFHWHGQHILQRNAQVNELAGLLYARGIRSLVLHPGVTADHVVALFGVATGTAKPEDALLGQIALSMSRRTHRFSNVTPRDSGVSSPAAPAASDTHPPGAVAIQAAPGVPATARATDPLDHRPTGAFRFDAVPVDVQVERAIAEVAAAETPEAQRKAVGQLGQLEGVLVSLKDIARVAAAIAALDRTLARASDPALVEQIGSAAGRLADKAAVERMVARLGEPNVPIADRETLVAALAALATLSIDPVLHACLAAPLDQREPYRAIVRRAGERAMEPLGARLQDADVSVLAAAAELLGFCGSPEAVPLLLGLLRHESDFVRESAVKGLSEIGGHDIIRPIIPALKDDSVLVRHAAVHAIGGAGDNTALTVLVRRLDQEQDEGVLAELLRAIGLLGAGRETLDILAHHAEPGSRLHRRSPLVRAAAIEAIAALGGGGAEAKGLLQLYTHDKEPAVRKAAEAGLR